MKAWFEEHPLAASVIIWIADIVFVLAGAWLLSLLFPDMPGYGRGLSQSLVLVLVGVLLVAAMLSVFRWWRLAGFVGTAQWRDLRVLWLPVVILLLPFVKGVRPLPPNELLTLVVAYAATAFFEEAIYRGAILGLLRPRGIWTAVIVSSLLFGLVHFSNIVLRGNPGSDRPPSARRRHRRRGHGRHPPAHAHDLARHRPARGPRPLPPVELPTHPAGRRRQLDYPLLLRLLPAATEHAGSLGGDAGGGGSDGPISAGGYQWLMAGDAAVQHP